MSDTTTITIDKSLKEEISQIGLKSESYNDIVKRLFDSYVCVERDKLRSYAKELSKKYSSSDPERSLILEDVAEGNSKSWDELKKELMD